MKRNALRSALVCVLAGLVCAACASLDLAHCKAREVRFYGGLPGKQLRVVTETDEVAAVVQAFARATRVRRLSNADYDRLWQMCFDVDGDKIKGRWIYETKSGMFSRMDPVRQTVYRLTEEDRARFNEFFKPAEEPAPAPKE